VPDPLELGVICLTIQIMDMYSTWSFLDEQRGLSVARKRRDTGGDSCYQVYTADETKEAGGVVLTGCGVARQRAVEG